MQTGPVTDNIEEIRRQSIAVLHDLTTRAETFELPKPPETLEMYRRKLWSNEYKVLVVGEAKRGKSTFVNALIGQDILPTDVDISTSQVFKIRPSEQEGYRLRFEDGSGREISRGDLPLYGSQTTVEAGNAPTLDRIVRWIEVDVPVRFLPKGVSMLDTPGLGALYANHAQITHRFVPEADAVIFVLESGQPVTEDDLRFVEELLDVTRNIFFIQTKIDLFDKDKWQATRLRSQEILKERFKDRLPTARVWPISSTNLRKAAAGKGKTEEAYLMVSRHKELEAALQAFLARVAGWRRAADAMLATAEYYRTGRKVLAGRLAGSSGSSDPKRVALHKAATQHKKRFDAEWDPRGRKLVELKDQIQRTMFVGKQGFAKYLQPGGNIELAQKARIDRIESLDEANRFAREMPEQVTGAAIKGWTYICRGVQDRCTQLMVPLADAADSVSAPVELDLSVPTVPPDGPGEDFKHNYSTMLRSAIGGGIMLGGAGSIANMLLTSGMMAALATPAAVAAAPAVIVLAGFGIRGVMKGEVRSAKIELNGRLREVLSRVQRHFFDVNLAHGRLSLVDEYFSVIERTVNERIDDLVRQKSSEANAEIARLAKTAKLNDRQRDAQRKRIESQIAEWDKLGKRTKQVMLQIKTLKEAGTVPAAGRAAAGKG
jgi:GTPase SAR1 family protein